METMVFASSLIVARAVDARSDAPRPRPRDAGVPGSAPRHGLRDVSRVAAALAGVALYAGALLLLG
jgi:hypothetical protein